MSRDSEPQNLLSVESTEAAAQEGASSDPQRAPAVPVVTQRRFVVVEGPVTTRASSIAAVQEGRVARWQLMLAALSHGQIKRRLRSGVLMPIHRGVYAYGHRTETKHSTEISALLTRGPEALIRAHRADAFWARQRVAAEYDSYRWHSSRSAWARDRRKDRYCVEHDIELVRVTDEDLGVGDGPYKLVARLAGLIAARG